MNPLTCNEKYVGIIDKTHIRETLDRIRLGVSEINSREFLASPSATSRLCMSIQSRGRCRWIPRLADLLLGIGPPRAKFPYF